jgi:hypothetical protein
MERGKRCEASQEEGPADVKAGNSEKVGGTGSREGTTNPVRQP